MIILKAENISKQYRLGLVGTGTISHDLNRWWAGIRGKEDPYLKVGSVNDRSTKADSDYVWALRDINFEVQQGEVLGIIGKNGAGKSTLLKILSRVTIPTTGEIKTKGRIASLLEVGTGFHPELTGRENIYLNGAILGMTKAEIKSKEAEIIEFSGCERYVDTPVKRYSSGMRVRLAFAVAAFLEPDILVIDEVLAVGDAEFQKKAIGKMQDISKGDGRTVLFVSHNMAAVENLCTRAIVLEHGSVVFAGETTPAIDYYLNLENTNLNESSIEAFIENQSDDILRLTDFLVTQNEIISANFYTNKTVKISISYEVFEDVMGLRVGFDLIDLSKSSVLFRAFEDDDKKSIEITKKGFYSIESEIPENIFKNGYYGVKLAIGIHNKRWIIFDDNVMVKFNMVNVNGLNRAYSDSRPGVIMPHLKWRKNI
ncbi:ABC transporter ATP-binding protein [uncultured Gelidibacter sp.]|uniref:ABC transporter ATP-binding protein n=1 Tax=uncultured Gelidibacter sp. TaxID=259318 RepID=UPI002607433D|nr:ABC transporter ATP-binding protein [uncultured Gelidibacter sp.]